MTIRRIVLVMLLPWGLVGCPDEVASTEPTGDIGADVVMDLGFADAAPDVPPDAAPDVSPDVPPDTAPDVPPDTAPDVSHDTALDVPHDTAPDVPHDVVNDAAPDASSADTAVDVTPDTGPETLPDGVSMDAGGDVSDSGNAEDAEPVEDVKPTEDAASDSADAVAPDGSGGDASIGDSDTSCLQPGELGGAPSTPADVPIPEFYDLSKVALSFAADSDYTAYFGEAPPTPLGEDWLVFAHAGRHPYGFSATISKVGLTDGCTLQASLATTRLGSTCSNFAATWPVGAAAVIAAPFSPHTSEVALELAQETVFDCQADGVQAFGTCTESAWCAPGFICAGITRFSEGLCLDASNLGAFESGPLDVAIPDGGTVTSELDASGLATVDMDVIVSLTVTHPDPASLTITLTNPATNEVMVWNQEASPYALSAYPTPGTLSIVRIPVGFSGDESVNGTWTLTVTTAAGGGAGTLNAWGLEIMSRFD